MAKDPAFLFYPNDFSAGTALLTRHQKGCYMDLLIAQFNHGHLSLENIRTVLGNDFAVWGSLSKKFAQDAAGNFFNERLETEMDKRKEYSSKQQNRALDGWKKRKLNTGISHGNAVALPKESGNEIENRNENRNQGGVGGSPSQAQIESIFTELGLPAAEGENLYLWVKGKQGWESIKNWVDYTMAVAKRKLNEKNFNNNGKRDSKREPNPHGTTFGNL